MPYNQITSALTIAPGNDPVGPSKTKIQQIIENSLVRDGYSITWSNKRSQPYQLVISDGTTSIDLYIYAWRITNGGRKNLVDEKRIQIQKGVNNIGFNRPITTTQKTLLLGIYDSPSGEPVFAAWDATSPFNIGHTQKSCQVSIQELLQGILDGINKCTDTHGNIIYTFTSDYLASYIDLVNTGNILNTGTATGSFVQKVKKASIPGKKKRTARSTASLLSSIGKLSSTEKDTIVKQRVGQGLFKDLLKNKYGCKCALCNINTENMLIASHIKKWSDCANDTERLDENNGLLLCAHHDALFDKHLITFDENTGALISSSTLTPQEKIDLNISAIPNITVNAQMKPYLTDHHSKLK